MSKDIVAEATGKMPFSGKHTVKYLFQKGREASRNGELTGKLANAAALGGFALLHAVQLKMGITELSNDGGQNPFLVGVDALYTTANAMATYTQASLAARVVATPSERTSAVAVTPDGTPMSVTTGGYRPEANIKLGSVTPTELAVTLGGQALFLATMH